MCSALGSWPSCGIRRARQRIDECKERGDLSREQTVGNEAINSARRVEARATLLNKAKVKSRSESNRFDVVAWVVRVAQFGIVSRNCGMQPSVQTGDCVREGCAEIRVGGAAVASPPAGIHRELLKVRKPSSLRDERDLAGLQRGELPQVNLLLAFGC